MRKITFYFFGIFIGMLSGISIAEAQCGFTLTVTAIPPSCPGNCDGSASVSITGYSGVANYDWSPGSPTGDGTNSISGLCDGIYTVMVMDTTGCFQFASGTVSTAPPICMVTTDAQSLNNLVFWDKTPYADVDSFIVYREVSPGTYARIAATPYDSLSRYEDTARSIGPAGANGDPNTGSYRYKLQAHYSCGMYSSLSPYHNTIYIVDAGAGEFAWSIPYTIEGAASPVVNYILICDTANIDFWTPVAVVPPSDTTAVDPGFASHSSIANWRVKTSWPISCSPTRTAVNTTRSNIKHAPAVSTGSTIYNPLENAVLVYPNPANEFVTIEYSNSVLAGTLRIMNILGEIVYEEQITGGGSSIHTKKIGIKGYAAGLYTISISSEASAIHRKFLVK
jgi:hypothetical protein